MTPSPLSALSDRELSTRARAWHVALLLGSLCMSTVTGSLWLTEPHLPARTSLAFAIMTGIGLCWAAYAWWTLRTQRPLLAFHRVVATRLAFTFSSAATAGSLYLALAHARPEAWSAAAIFSILTLIAAILLARARRRYNALYQRKAELERRLQSGERDLRE